MRAALCLAAIPVGWWVLARSPAADQIFGLYTVRRFIGGLALTYVATCSAYVVAKRERRPTRVVQCALGTVSILLCLGLLELTALLGLIDYRAVFPRSERSPDDLKPWEHPDNTLDRELIYISRPNAHLDGSMLGGLTALYRLPLERRYHYDVQFDSHGFRNDHDIEQAPIVLIGDSFVQSTLVPRQSLVSSRLSQLFGVEVANLGQGGYGPQQELAVLRRYGLPPRPRVVVWMFFEGNDLYEAGRFEELTRDWDAILSDRNRFDKRSFSVNAVIALRDATTPLPTTVSDDARRKSCEFTRSRSEEGKTLYFFYTVRLSADDQAGLAATESSIRTARNIAAENGSELLLVYVPAKLRVYRDFCAFPADGYAQSWPLDNLSAVLRTWAAENRIAYLDLTDALKAEAARGELVYFPDDTHWNAAGNEVAATVIANAIAEAGWLR